MQKLSAKWVPKCQNADQKCQWCQSSEQLLEFFQRDPNDFLLQLVTMDETWVHHYNPETSNNQWSDGIAVHPAPKNSECKNPLGKFSPKFFGIKTASSSLIIFQRAKLLLDLKGLAIVQTFQHFKVAKNVFGSFLYSEVD